MFVKERITKKKYQEATFGALVVYLMFYVFCIIVSCLYAIREWKNPKERNLLEPREATSLTDSGNAAPENQYGALSEAKALSSPIRQTTDRSPVSGESSSITTDTDEHSYVEPDVDMLDDAESEKDVFRTKTFLFVADLDRKPPKRTRKKSKMYHWNLLTIAVFYALPVIQLVFTYQRVSNITGNEDMCYYNFLCSYPQGSLSDFNHVYSNIGYILLGFLFLGLVWRRDLLYRRAVALNDRIEKYYGVPGYFGLFYTMGIALMMEGVLSGCYHVCPNYANFQFDTTFMYLIAWLCMLRIYQARHPDISPHAHTVYVVFASLIIVCVVGVLYGSIFFWILYAVVHVLSCLAVSAQIYYMGRWKMNFGIFKRIYLTLKNDLYTHFTRPMYMDRLVLLTVGNIINWSIALYGLIKQPKDFGSFLLSIFIVNLLLYTSFYIVMKIRHKEKILPLPLIYILLSAITWIAALYFFLQHDTSWKISPAESRNLNKPCMILDFYDDHDIWHFLSSSALFFGFMILLTLDDDLIYTPRDKIPVF
ncbi:SIDT1 (predicted) [Pycnogonum litorale]